MKVLVISHNPIGTQCNMGKTMLSLFSALKREEICQLYIYPTLPDVDLCSSYFRITDKDVLRAYYSLKLNCGEVTPHCDSSNMYENAQDEKIYTNPKNKNDIRMILRDLMWKCAHWYTKKLKLWLEKENPTCIFVAPGPSTFLYDIALKIAKQRNIPIVTYICDDYYFVKTPKKLLARVRVAFLKRKISCLMKATSKLVVICDALKKEYSKEFFLPTEKIMTGSDFVFAKKQGTTAYPTTISYFGNICCNRYISLAEIGNELDLINEEKGTNFKLNIYTSEKNSQILFCFSGIKSVNLCPFISGKDFEEALLNSHILLHVEAFDEESIDLVKHSISTKIPDSLASGVPLMAYGPESIASIEHLRSNQCAIIATSRDELEDALKKAFFDENIRNTVVLKAMETAKKYHSNKDNGDLLRQILLSL